MLDIQLLSAGIGLFIGLILALTGAGGAILALPLLMFVLHLSIQQAAPIVLLAIFIASSIGALQGLRQGIVRYKTAMLIATFGMIFAPIGVKLAHHTPQHLLGLILALVLVFVAVRMWHQASTSNEDNTNSQPPVCAVNPVTSKLFWTASCTKRLIATGSIAGLLSGLLGVGGGFVVIPSLYKVSNFNSKTITATTLAVVALISAASIASYWQHSTLQMNITLPFVMSATTAMLLLSELRDKIPNNYSQRGFAILCVIAAIHLGLKAIN